MPVIHVLSPHVADLIAAGEVVERPASAVKELLENAVDAGARTVVLELRAGGRDYIRVTDDGVGMAPEDAGVCFLRHATSKLSDERGLEAIGTLGFRGEALAAISAVSRITLTTRRRGAAMGVCVEVEAGEIVSMEETGCPEGTTITVRDLFYNTPARQKFLGSDRSEGAACVQSALRTALGRPDVSFRCLRDGQEEFFSPGDGTAKSAVYALLGREAAAAGGDRKRRRWGKGLRLRARLLPRQPRRAVFLLQRPSHPLARFAGRARAGIQKYRHGRQVPRVRALYHAAQRSCGRERPSDEGGGKVRKRKARF